MPIVITRKDDIDYVLGENIQPYFDFYQNDRTTTINLVSTFSAFTVKLFQNNKAVEIDGKEVSYTFGDAEFIVDGTYNYRANLFIDDTELLEALKPGELWIEMKYRYVDATYPGGFQYVVEKAKIANILNKLST